MIEKLKNSHKHRIDCTITHEEAGELVNLIDLSKAEITKRIIDELEVARKTNTRLNKRCQSLESALNSKSGAYMAGYRAATDKIAEYVSPESMIHKLRDALQRQGKRLSAANARVEELRELLRGKL